MIQFGSSLIAESSVEGLSIDVIDYYDPRSGKLDGSRLSARLGATDGLHLTEVEYPTTAEALAALEFLAAVAGAGGLAGGFAATGRELQPGDPANGLGGLLRTKRARLVSAYAGMWARPGTVPSLMRLAGGGIHFVTPGGGSVMCLGDPGVPDGVIEAWLA